VLAFDLALVTGWALCDAYDDNFGVVETGIIDAHVRKEPSPLTEGTYVKRLFKMRRLGAEVGPGDFAENLTVEGKELFTLPIGTRLGVGQDAILRVTQIGKECHEHCAIFKQIGTCVMPVEGIFTRVIKGGVVRVGDELNII